MKKNVKRFGSMLLALVMCLSMSVVAFAAENTEPCESTCSASNVASTYAVGQTLYQRAENMSTNSMTYHIVTNEANWDADFSMSISGSPSERFEVTMVAANGEVYRTTVYGNGSGAYFNMSYAKAGTYKFTFTRLANQGATVTCVATIYD